MFRFNFRITKPAIHPHANTQNPDVIAYSSIEYIKNWISLCTLYIKAI